MHSSLPFTTGSTLLDAPALPPLLPTAVRTGVSVVIVNWNTRDLLVRLLGDLLDRPLGGDRKLEVIVVDNASDDDSVRTVRVLFPTVRVVDHRENLGFAAGVNAGVAIASQPFVLLANTDVRIQPGAIEQLCTYAETHPHAAVIGPRIVDETGRPKPSCWRHPSLPGLFCYALGLNRVGPGSRWLDPESYRSPTARRPGPVDCVSGCVLLARRAPLLALGGLDSSFFLYYEETDLCRRMRQHGFEVHYAPVASFAHSGGGSSRRVKDRTFLEFRRSRILYHRKHGGPLAALAARTLLVVGHALRAPVLTALGWLPGPRGATARERHGRYWRALRWLLRTPGLVPSVPRQAP